jgi:hypothetical protein
MVALSLWASAVSCCCCCASSGPIDDGLRGGGGGGGGGACDCADLVGLASAVSSTTTESVPPAHEGKKLTNDPIYSANVHY